MISQAFKWMASERRDSENLAMLVDRDDYWLNSEYASWTADPDDREAKAERDRRKKAGIKPPSFPILPPVAQRSPEDTEAAIAAFLAKKEEFAPKPAKPKLSDLLGQWQVG
ncbi:hypothetical protein [Rhodococcus qingshengii]|uniref:hypothetical protein n=1 Tax=Rhodococcus qingshengii TaxID=334542 RepID=UPI001ADF49E5|nr:hypothetical protein [Rhodococcus qingshengii]MCQ4148672.1 hypothetical protein [Rhodococcus qingshengii]